MNAYRRNQVPPPPPLLSFRPGRNSLLQRKGIGAANDSPVSSFRLGAIVEEAMRSPGQPLCRDTRAFFEPRFGHDFSAIRVHADSRAAESARAVAARAYTVGRDLVFGDGEFNPETGNGRRLLAHELTHALQQGQRSYGPGDLRNLSLGDDVREREARDAAEKTTNSKGEPGALRTTRTSPAIQRELMAYLSEHTEFLPALPASSAVTYQVFTADAENIKNALKPLIAAKKIGLRSSGDRLFFFNSGATGAEIEAAFAAAGFARASAMAAGLMDEHNTSVYSRGQVTKMSGLFTMTVGKQAEVVERKSERPLTASERTEAQLVFGTKLDFDQITVAEDPVMGSLGYARTLPRAIYFPPGSFGKATFMSWLIHELTHSWQYQHGVSVFTTIYHAIEANYDYGDEAGLLAALKAGKHFTAFTTEQQGDILRDYYRRLKKGQNVSSWQPFVNQVQK